MEYSMNALNIVFTNSIQNECAGNGFNKLQSGLPL